MPTLVLDPPPPELEELLERRRRLGLDKHDEVWDGVLHVTPGPSFEHGRVQWQLAEILGPLARAAGLTATLEVNVGDSEENFRVPDGGLHRPGAGGVWLPTVALVIEIVSPDDESWVKLPFYARQGVDEVLIVDPQKRSVDWLRRVGEGYAAVDRSGLIELHGDELAHLIDWP